jgi:hypothetical protein
MPPLHSFELSLDFESFPDRAYAEHLAQECEAAGRELTEAEIDHLRELYRARRVPFPPTAYMPAHQAREHLRRSGATVDTVGSNPTASA